MTTPSMRVPVNTLDDVSRLVKGLQPGQSAGLNYDDFKRFFPPGISNDAAKDQAREFAQAHGCEIDHRAAEKHVWVVKPRE